MATCRECIHLEVCDSRRYVGEYIEDDEVYSEGVDKECVTFKDKSRFIELPFIAMIEQTIVNGKPNFTKSAASKNGMYCVVYSDPKKWKGLSFVLLTNKEVIKAFECCEANEGNRPNCKECPYFWLEEKPVDCHKQVRKNALALINRQKAEIEALNKRIDGQKHALFEQQAYTAELQKEVATAKAKAVKEFAERLKEECSFETDVSLGYGRPCYEDAVPIIAIDNLVKEMAGDKSG